MDATPALPIAPLSHEWLPQEHLAYFILDVVRGERPYAIGMMTGLLLFGYSVGEFSSRRIAGATYAPVDFRVH